MATRRRTRGGGGSVESTGSGTPTNMMNESIDVNPNDLLAMLAGEEEETDEEEEEEEEGRDIVTALDGQFAGAIDQRKSELKRKRESEDMASAPAPAAGAGAAVAAAPGPVSGRLMKTVTRIRKLGPDAGPLSLQVDEGSSTTVTTTNPDPKTSRVARESFVSDRVLDESVGQEGVFREIEPVVTGVLQGSSSIILTYGSTGSGKSHTIMGAGDDADVGPGDDQRERVLASANGILARALERMYQQAGRGTSGEDGLGSGGGESGGGVVVSVRVMEVYNNRLYDLLREGDQTGRHLSIRRGDDGHDVIEGLSVGFPADLPSALGFTKSARGRAHVNRTRLNAQSSRGHVIFVLGVHGSACKTAADLRPTDPVMYICDLAGPERQDRAALASDTGGGGGGGDHAELRKIEATHINTDTTALFRAWKLVRGGAKSASYRARTLTRVLKGLFVRPRDSPHVNCVMMVCVNPAASEYGETNKVLKNSQISSTVLAALEEGPSIRKRQRTSNRAGAGGGAAAAAAAAAAVVVARGSSAGQVAYAASEGKGKRKGKLRRADVAAQASGPEDGGEQGLVVELREEIERLRVENARMKEEHDVALYDVEERTREEAEGMIEELENELEEKRLKIRQLNEQLQDKSPLGAGARAAVAQSAMKLRAKQAESVRKLERETTREADEEVARTAKERARAEEELAATMAERDQLKAFAEREAERADAAEAKTTRVLSDRSEEQSARRELEDKVERLEEAAAAEAGRVEDLEEKLRSAQEEIARLESGKQQALPGAAPAAAAVLVRGDSRAHSFPTMAGGSEEEEDEGFGGRSGGSTGSSPSEHGGSWQEDEEQEGSSVSMLGDFGRGSRGSSRSRSGSSSSSSNNDVHRETDEGEENVTVGASSPPRSGSASADVDDNDDISDNDDRSEEVDDEAAPPAPENHEPSPLPSPSPKVVAKTRSRRRVGKLESSQITASPTGGAGHQGKPTQRVDRKPLRNLQIGATAAGTKGAKGGKKKVGVDDDQEAAAVVVEAEDEEQSEGTTSRPGRGGEKRTKAEKERAKKAEEGSETQRCKEMRKNARVSKPSPDVVVMTEKQAKSVDIGRKIVRERRRRR